MKLKSQFLTNTTTKPLNQNKMKKQISAVEWLVEKIQQANPTFKFDALIREAKAMEKKQIIDALMTSEVELLSWGISAEQYYNETFK